MSNVVYRKGNPHFVEHTGPAKHDREHEGEEIHSKKGRNAEMTERQHGVQHRHMDGDPNETDHIHHVSTHHNEAVRRTHHHDGGEVHSEGGRNMNHPQGRGVLDDLGDKRETMDSPVPSHAERPNEGIRSKAEEVATEDSKIGSEFHPDGVMHRG
jgi:hypothetical protein